MPARSTSSRSGPTRVDLDQLHHRQHDHQQRPVARPVQILPTNFTHNILGTDFNEAFDGETAAGTYGVTGAFSFDGRGGDDHAWGGEEGDTLSGGSGNDMLFGNGGNDTLSGGDNADTLDGRRPATTRWPAAAATTRSTAATTTTISTAAAATTRSTAATATTRLHGGAGNDTLNGGAGTDTAVYDGPRGDYSIAMHDRRRRPRRRLQPRSRDNEPSNGNEGVDTLNSIEVLRIRRTGRSTRPSPCSCSTRPTSWSAPSTPSRRRSTPPRTITRSASRRACSTRIWSSTSASASSAPGRPAVTSAATRPTASARRRSSAMPRSRPRTMSP